MRSKHSVSRKLFVLLIALSSKKMAGCNPITNSNLNDHIREFSSKNDSINSTDIKTLQKEVSGRYANFSPVPNPVRFKDVPDSALSSSSYSRGLLHHDHPGYNLHEYEESPHVYGYEYHAPVPVPVHHGFEHHGLDHYHGHGHHDVNYHHKHYDHALAAKAILWPLAGIALLGAAAALVTNPVLLQLGVVSGRRKRRDTEENFDTPDDTKLSWLKDAEQIDESKVATRVIKKRKKQSDEVNFQYKRKSHGDELKHKTPVKYSIKQDSLFKELRVHPTVQSPVDIGADNTRRFIGNKNVNKNKLIPVPLLLKEEA